MSDAAKWIIFAIAAAVPAILFIGMILELIEDFLCRRGIEIKIIRHPKPGHSRHVDEKDPTESREGD